MRHRAVIHMPDGQIPPYTALLAGPMSEVLRWASNQVAGQCHTVHQAVTLLTDMAAAYEEDDHR